MLIPKVWLIIIAAHAVGSPVVQTVPFSDAAHCEAAAQGIHDAKPEWTAANTIIVCSITGPDPD